MEGTAVFAKPASAPAPGHTTAGAEGDVAVLLAKVLLTASPRT
ncbi:hypothetical protein ABH940_002101 [Streptacidiphilus sp. BW17]